jgi:membrane fusion protein, multidrug efflux system
MAGAVLASGRDLDQPVWRDLESQSPAANAGDTFGIKVVARASRDALLSFQAPAEVAEVLVRGGQRVEKGALLVRARDDEARLTRDLQRLAAETDLPVLRAKAAMEQAEVELKAQEEVERRNKEHNLPRSKIEMERARTAFLVRKLEHELSQLEHAQQRLQLEFREAQLARFRIVAPFGGVIERVECEVGETRREGEPALRIVCTDQLWMDVPTPVFQTLELSLKPNDPAWVMMDLPGEPKVFIGKVIEVSPVSDSLSRTRQVRVELENPYEWPAGLNAWVRFTEPSAEWLARVEKFPARETADAGRLKEPVPGHPGAPE